MNSTKKKQTDELNPVALVNSLQHSKKKPLVKKFAYRVNTCWTVS